MAPNNIHYLQLADAYHVEKFEYDLSLTLKTASMAYKYQVKQQRSMQMRCKMEMKDQIWRDSASQVSKSDTSICITKSTKFS